MHTPYLNTHRFQKRHGVGNDMSRCDHHVIWWRHVYTFLIIIGAFLIVGDFDTIRVPVWPVREEIQLTGLWNWLFPSPSFATIVDCFIKCQEGGSVQIERIHPQRLKALAVVSQNIGKRHHRFRCTLAVAIPGRVAQRQVAHEWRRSAELAYETWSSSIVSFIYIVDSQRLHGGRGGTCYR